MSKIVLGLTAGGGQLKSPEADIVKGFVVEDHALICVFNELVYGESGVIGLNYSVGNFRGRKD